MRASDIFGGGSDVGAIVPGIFENTDKFLPCDGVSKAPVDSLNRFLGEIYPEFESQTTYGNIRVANNTDTEYGLAISDIVYGHGIYLAVCNFAIGSIPSGVDPSGSKLFYSEDGETWIETSTPSSTIYYDCATVIDDGFLIAGITANAIGSIGAAYSPDGKNWLGSGAVSNTLTTTENLGRVNKIVSNGRQFALRLSGANTTFVSGTIANDGITLTQRNPSQGGQIRDLCFYQNALFIAGNSSLLYTIDFSLYTSFTAPSSNFFLATNGSRLVAVGSSVNQARTYESLADTVGTARNNPAINGVAYNGSIYMGILNAGTGIATSPDGVAWTSVPFPAHHQLNTPGIGQIRALQNKFVLLKLATNTAEEFAHVTTDGTSYTGFAVPFVVAGFSGSGVRIFDSVYAPELGLFVAVGSTCDSISSSGPFMLTSTDGKNWKRAYLPISSLGIARAIHCVDWNGSRFVAVAITGGSVVYVLTSTDGVNWLVVNTGITQPSNIKCDVKFGNGRWVIVYPNSANFLESLDGITWTSRRLLSAGTATGNTSVYLEHNGSGFVFVNGSGEAWSSPTGLVDTWTRTAGLGHTFNSIAVVGTTFVATTSSTNDTVLTANNQAATAWTSRATNTANANYFTGLVRVGTKLVAIPYSTFGAYVGLNLAQSTDGVTWSSIACPVARDTRGEIVTGVSNGVDLFMLPARRSNLIWTVKNLTTWEVSLLTRYNMTSLYGLSDRKAAMLNDGTRVFPMVSSSTNTRIHGVYLISENDIEFIPIYIPSLNSLATQTTSDVRAIITNGTEFVAIGILKKNSLNYLFTAKSLNGRDWTDIQVSTETFQLQSSFVANVQNAEWIGDKYIVMTNYGRYYTSSDGVTWTTRVTPFDTSTFRNTPSLQTAYCPAAGKLIVLTTLATGPTPSGYWYTADGINWTFNRVPEFTAGLSVSSASHICASENEFIIVTNRNTSNALLVWRSIDGINWKLHRVNKNLSTITYLIRSGEYFILHVGRSTVLVSKDGTRWSDNNLNTTGPTVQNGYLLPLSGPGNRFTYIAVASSNNLYFVNYKINDQVIFAPNLSLNTTTNAPFYNYSLVIR